MEKLSISQLSVLTSKDRRTIKQRLSGLPFEQGEGNAHLYDPPAALQAIYTEGNSTTLETAKIRLAEEQAALAKTRNECLRKERIHAEDIASDLDKATQQSAAIIKATVGKVMTQQIANEIFDGLRRISAALKG